MRPDEISPAIAPNNCAGRRPDGCSCPKPKDDDSISEGFMRERAELAAFRDPPTNPRPGGGTQARFIVVDGQNWYPESVEHVKKLLAAKDAEIESLRKRLGQVEDENREMRQQIDDMGHVTIEAGVVPGEPGGSGCRCEQCRRVAKAMAEAGYLEGRDPWWDRES